MAALPSSSSAAASFAVAPLAEAGEATRDLYERYGAQIFSFCLHRLGNREEAEDARQTTFLNALRGLQRGVSPEFESAWLFTIARNVCLTRQRSLWRRQHVETPTDLDAIQDLVPARQTTVEERVQLSAAIESVPEAQRRALLLRECRGLSYREIAAELGLSQAAVETLLFRARRSLARALTDEEPRSRRRRTARSRLTAGGNIGSFVAALKGLFLSGGAKIAATVATVAATSAVAAVPAVRHDLVQIVPQHARTGHAQKRPIVDRTPNVVTASVAPVRPAAPEARPPIASPPPRPRELGVATVRQPVARHEHVAPAATPAPAPPPVPPAATGSGAASAPAPPAPSAAPPPQPASAGLQEPADAQPRTPTVPQLPPLPPVVAASGGALSTPPPATPPGNDETDQSDGGANGSGGAPGALLPVQVDVPSTPVPPPSLPVLGRDGH